MAKSKKKKKNKPKLVKSKPLIEIEKDRTGGSIVLHGFSYQLLFSCYLILKELSKEGYRIKLEGIEDVDLYKSMLENSEQIFHIQLKSSINKQDASFFDSILRNFLEVYLSTDNKPNTYFKLIYNFDISKGNLSKLVENKIDSVSRKYWIDKIEIIKKTYPLWNWDSFDYTEFINHLCFEKITKDRIVAEIYKILTKDYSINTCNEVLYINAFFYNVFHHAIKKSIISKEWVNTLIHDIQENISKGTINPSINWIEKIDFNLVRTTNNGFDYFEGKKATPEDIKDKLPIRRFNLEQEIEESINNHQITVIKSSSGQGKTTLAYQVAYNLKDEYSIYKLKWCKEKKELQHIVDYFHSVLKCGNQILIIIDNLDIDLKEWNQLSQDLRVQLSINYRIILTTREDDWYRYSGDQSSLRNLKIIDIYLDKTQAQKIYENLHNRKLIHCNVHNWQTSWEQVEDKRLLIEYVYLLTHGELIQHRISNQLKQLMNDGDSSILIQLLRILSQADVIGVRITLERLFKEIKHISKIQFDLNSILERIENEFFIKVNDEYQYLEGLHPVRSKHISDYLHKFCPISETLEKIVKYVDLNYVEKLYSKIPLIFEGDKDLFYKDIAQKCIFESYSYMNQVIKGIFSGSFIRYFIKNKKFFDEANTHGGLLLFLVEINPWNSDLHGGEVKTLKSLHEQSPDNSNIKFLYDISKEVEQFNIKESDIYIFLYYLFDLLKGMQLKRDIKYFSFIVNWLIRIDSNFSIISESLLDNIWTSRNEWDIEELGQIFYAISLSDKALYLEFIKEHKNEILLFIQQKTNSFEIFEHENDIKIEYILLPHEIDKSNDESVKRINMVCKFLPIYETYYTNSISPKIDLIEIYRNIDQSFKKMPRRNITIGFNVDLTKIWRNSILSQYEFTSVYDWQSFWFKLRKKIVNFYQLNFKFVKCIITSQPPAKLLTSTIDKLVIELKQNYLCENYFPHENRPFEEKIKDFGFDKRYLSHLFNYLNQFTSIVLKGESCHIALHNLKDCKLHLNTFQSSIRKICDRTTRHFDLDELEKWERLELHKLILINEYFTENGTNRAFTPNSLIKWEADKKEILFNEINEILEIVQDYCECKILRPINLIYNDHLSTLPIGIYNIDTTNEEELQKILESLIPIGKLKITFILLIFLDENLSAAQYGIRLNNHFYQEVINNLEEDSEITSEPPIPIPFEIDSQHTNCFKESINLTSSINNEFSIDILLSLLWKYSYYKNKYEYISSDQELYLNDMLRNLTIIIDKEFNRISNGLPESIKNELVNIKVNVKSKNEYFSEKELNSIIMKYVNIMSKDSKYMKNTI
jgi:hypothetical protein